MAIRLHRLANWLFRKNLRWLARLCWLLNKVINGCDISPQACLGAVTIVHTVGVVIGGDAEIGDGTFIMSGVVIGGGGSWVLAGHVPSHAGPRGGEGHPKIGANVFIGANAVIIGSIMVGSGSTIGAGAVVTRDVPPGATAVGVPARIRQSP